MGRHTLIMLMVGFLLAGGCTSQGQNTAKRTTPAQPKESKNATKDAKQDLPKESKPTATGVETSLPKESKPAVKSYTAEEAIAAIQKLGGKVERDSKTPDKRVLQIDFFGSPVTDKDLAYVQGLGSLEKLSLAGTQITDDGLAYLQKLSNLQDLHLNFTAVTDKGLEHLKGLTNLRSLDLLSTKVTNSGVQGLQKALPKVQISR
jgi:hypothetical protein